MRKNGGEDHDKEDHETEDTGAEAPNFSGENHTASFNALKKTAV